MNGFVTYCFSDWQAKTFQRGIMRMRHGLKTDEPIRRTLRNDEVMGRDYYVKDDPNFEQGTYSVCHRRLRKVLKPGDVLFFRTLWRERQYFVGYFVVRCKTGDVENPVIHADIRKSRLIDFKLPITLYLAKLINPATKYRHSVHQNTTINGRLGRNYKRIDARTTQTLMMLVEEKIDC